MDDAGYRAARASTNIGGGASNGARRGQSAEQSRGAIGHTLRDQFAIGTMPAAGHAVGHHRREQRFHTGQKGDRERSRQQLAGTFKRNAREIEHRQRRRNTTESRANSRHRQVQRHCRQRTTDDGNQKRRP